MTKLLVTLILFSASLNLFATSVTEVCEKPLAATHQIAHKRTPCLSVENENPAAKNQPEYSGNADKENLTHIRLSKRQPSIAESLMTIFFIPVLILLWFSRFIKSNK